MASQRDRAWKLAAGLVRGVADQAGEYAEGLARSQADAFWESAFNDLTRRYKQIADRLPSELIGGYGSGGDFCKRPGKPLSWHASFTPRFRRQMPTVRGTDHRAFTEFINEAFQDSTQAPPEVDLHVDFEETGGTLRFSSGVSRSGHTIAAGPAGVINARHGVIGSYGEVKAALRDIGDFIDNSEPLIQDQLRKLSADPADDSSL